MENTNLKKIIVETATESHEGHIPSAFSILDILWVLYDKILKIDSRNPKDENRDRFVLSKGHGSLGLYAVLASKGFFPMNELKKFGQFDSILGGHPDRNKVPGVEASTGSLGHGLPIGVGMALGLKLKESSSKVFVLVGDGEMNEGTMWESLLLASHHELNNLYCIVDNNHSTDRALKMGDLEKKFEAFGWQAKTIDGHNHKEIEKALSEKSSGKPIAVIANTIKGNGCKIMENNPEWHHRAPKMEEIDNILNQLT